MAINQFTLPITICINLFPHIGIEGFIVITGFKSTGVMTNYILSCIACNFTKALITVQNNTIEIGGEYYFMGDIEEICRGFGITNLGYVVASP